MAVKKTLLDRLIREAQDTAPEQSLLLDPRFDTRVKEQDRLRNLVATVEERGTQNPPGIPLADLEGQPFITSMSDRTRAGGLLTRINQIPLRDPVNLQGGQGFMFENPGAVWANAPGGVRQHQEAAQALKQRTGQDPLFIPWRMAPTGQDFATMSGEAMIGYAATNLSRKAKRKFDASMKNIIPDWPGIDSPESVTAFRGSRKTVREKAQTMMDRDFRNSGGLGLGEARLAVADPAQRVARDGGIQNIGRVNLDAPMIKNVGHPSYPAGLPGEGLGRTSQDIGIFELMPDEVRARGIVDPLNPPYNHIRSLQMKPYGGVITEEVLRNLAARGVDVTKPALVMGALGLGALGTEEAEAGPFGTAADLISRGFPEGTAQRIASGELPMDQASRMARAAEQGYTMPVYHGTGADITEFDGTMSGLGTHVGSPEQANNRLLDVASQRDGGYSSRATQGYAEGANVMPLLMRAGNEYRLKDIGEWNNAEAVSVGLKNTNIPHDRNMQYEASEEAASYEDMADWVASPENAEMLDELRGNIRDAGYDTIKYHNQVENKAYNTSGLRPDAQRQYDDLLSQYHSTLKQSAALRSRLDNEAIAGLPAEEQVRAITEGVQRPRTPEEDQLGEALARLSEQRDRVAETGAYSPTSYIALDDAQLRSVNAAFDPANKNSANLLASMGGAGLLGAAALAPGEAQATPERAPAGTPQSTRPSLMDMATLPTDLLTRFGEVTARDIGGLFAGAAQGPEAYERVSSERSIPISPLAERVAAGTDQAIGAGLGALLDYQPPIGPSGTDLLGMAAEGYQRIPEQYREPLLRTGMGLLGAASVFPGARAVGRAVSDRIPKRKKRSTAQ